MTRTDREHITFLARTILGGSRPAARVRSPPLLARLADKASFLLGTEVTLVGFASQIPDIFALSGLTTAVVVYTPRFIELTTAYRFALLTKASASERRALARTFFSEMLSAKLVREGSVDAALRVFLASWLHAPPLMLGSQWRLDSILQDQHVTQLTVVVGYGLAHEVGHFVTFPDQSTPAMLIDSIDRTLVHVLASMGDRPGRPVRISPSDQADLAAHARQTPDHPLNPRHIFDEVAADLFAWDVMFNLAHDVAMDSGMQYDPIPVACEIYVQMMVIYFAERAEVNSRNVGTRPTDWDSATRYAFHDASVEVRSRMVGMLLAELFAAHYPAGRTREAMKDAIVASLAELDLILRPDFREFERGISSAMQAADRGDAIDQDMVDLLGAATLRLAKGDEYFTQDAREFCRLVGETEAPGMHIFRGLVGK